MATTRANKARPTKVERALFAGFAFSTENSADDEDAFGLRTLLALGDLEFDPLAVLERLVTVHLNGGEVDENVLAAIDGDKAVALFSVEPLNGSLCHWSHPLLLVRQVAPYCETRVFVRIAVGDPPGRLRTIWLELRPTETLHEIWPPGDALCAGNILRCSGRQTGDYRR